MPGDRPRFSELLLDRRQRLGLTLDQASQVLRLKPQVLLAFEEGDFEQMPKSGYAQGMLASYARYLGLNPKQVTDQYAADLDAHLRGGERRSMRASTAHRGSSYNGSSSFPLRYEGARGLLPTSGGLAGDYGAFATTTAVPRGGSRTTGTSRDSFSSRDWGNEARRGNPVEFDEGERRYTTRSPSSGRRSRSSQANAYSTPSRAGRSSHSTRRAYGRDQVTTSRVGPGQYVDDLYYDNARPFDAANTTSGRLRSRDIASTRRPNVQRRRPSSASSTPRHGGIIGVIEAFFSDTRRAVITIMAIAALVLAVFTVSSVRGCIANQSSTGRTVEVTQENSSDATNDSSSNDSKAADEQALAEAAAAREQKAVPAETIVSVSVADAMVSWLDIRCDGRGVIADTVTGPWEQSFNVADSITIDVNNTTSVSVTENGELRQFDARASGIGTITIENAAKLAAATAADSSEEGESSSQTRSTDSASHASTTGTDASYSYTESEE